MDPPGPTLEPPMLIPSVDKVDHDHSYCNRSGSVMTSTTMSTVVEDDQVKSQKSQIVDARIMSETVMAEVKDGLNVSSRMRMEIEMKTRQQSAEKEWHSVRVQRITSSTCGQILTQKSKTVALLVRVLYHKRLTPPPPPIAWGLQNEQVACRSYQQHMLSIGHSGLTTQPIGFIVHPTKGWFGASPDAKVYDPSSHVNCHGIAEFKCPYSKRDISPQEACQDPQFCCELQSGTIHLKRNHNYYHQVQLQLYVGSDLYSWCDFCIYTTVGVAVERIYPSKEWQSTCLPILEQYYDTHILPEIVDPIYKPCYVW